MSVQECDRVSELSDSLASSCSLALSDRWSEALLDRAGKKTGTITRILSVSIWLAVMRNGP